MYKINISKIDRLSPDYKKIRTFIHIVILIITLGVINYLLILNSPLIEKQSGEEYAYEADFPETLKTAEDCITQSFTPKHSGLDEIRIRLAFNHTKILEQYPLSACLILKEGNTVLQTEELHNEDFENWRYYTFSPSVKLDKGKKYSLSLMQLSGYTESNQYPLSIIPFILHDNEPSEWLPENIECDFNGTTNPYELDIIYIYHYHDYKLFLWVISVDILMVFVLLAFYKLKLYCYKNIYYIYFLSLPPVNYVIVEQIVGNIGTIKVQYMLCNIILYYFMFGILLLFSRKPKNALIIFQIICPVSGLVEFYVYKFRGRPFMLQDINSIRTAQTVMNQYTYGLDKEEVLPLLFSLLIISTILLLPEKKWEQYIKIRRIGSVGLAFLFFAISSNVSIVDLNLWDVAFNYQNYGYYLTLSSEVKLLKQDPPEGYSLEAVKTIADNDKLEQVNSDEAESIIPQNIILIMNESWADFRYINSYEGDSTIMPYIDSLSGENVIKGKLHIPVFGAGTANSEYEVLTGNSTQFITPGATPYQLLVAQNEYGLASTLKSQGYYTLAMHPYNEKNWNRNNVYSYMGFEQFIAVENWPEEHQETIRWCISDKSSYETLIDQYEEHDGEKLFTFLVTMQNHGSYDYEEYESAVDLGNDNSFPLTEQYLSLIKETDAAFESLVKYFQTVKEPTMIIMFGDHYPSVDTSFYEMLFHEEWDDISLEEMQKAYTTPYIIWTNYALDPFTDITEMSANYFGSYILQLAGVDMPIYNQCLLNYMEKIPVLGVGMIEDRNNNWYSVEEIPDGLKKEYQDYQIIQYNNVYGKRKKVDYIFKLN